MRVPHPNFLARFPKSTSSVASGGLAQLPVSTAHGVEHPGFDDDAVHTALGDARYNSLISKIAAGVGGYSGAVFSCGHRKNAKGVEIHCIYASDLELFLVQGN